jgi:hypothetical protein
MKEGASVEELVTPGDGCEPLEIEGKPQYTP